MLTKRIIPCLDVKDGRTVKGVNFKELKDAGNPVELAKLYYQQGADELTFLDISASKEGRGTLLKIVSQVADEIFIPLTVGGGVRSVDDVEILLKAGADKIGINSAAILRPQLIKEIADKFGRQVVVLSCDARRTLKQSDAISERVQNQSNTVISQRAQNQSNTVISERANLPSGFEVTTHGGTRSTQIDLLEWVETAEKLGAGEILLNSMDADGTKNGFDTEMTKAVKESTSLPVIASGGAGKVADFSKIILETGVDAVLAASVFHFGEISISQIKDDFENNQIPVRR